MKVRPGKDFAIRHRPLHAGEGFAFVEVGALIKPGDEYFTQTGEWKPSTLRWYICPIGAKNLYRRRLPIAA
jgi:hypothetical protein